MARYDYECNDCNEVFEVSHGMNEKPEVKCKKCGSENVQKKFSLGIGFIVSGNSRLVDKTHQRAIADQCAYGEHEGYRERMNY